MKTNLRLLFTLLFVVSVVALRAGTMNDIRVSGTVMQQPKVGGRSVINVELVPDSKQLEEVMVVPMPLPRNIVSPVPPLPLKVTR